MNQKNNLIIGLIIAGVVFMSANVDADPRDFVEGLPIAKRRNYVTRDY